MILNNHDLWIKCAEWGSYIRSSDPGACMYGFSGEGSFQSREHAEQVIRYIEDDCLPGAETSTDVWPEDVQDLRDILETAAAFLEG